MSFGAIAASVAGSAASAFIGSKLNKSGGQAVQGRLVSDAALRGTPATNFNSTGGSLGFRIDQQGNRILDFNRSAAVDDVLSRIQGQSAAAAGRFSDLRGRVAPGFSELRESRLGAVTDAERRSIGSLKERLRSRRLGGSSFENMAISDERQRFGILKDQIAAETFTQELEMTRQLIANEFEAAVAGIGTMLEQFNFETSMVSQLTASANALQQSIVAARAGVSSTAAQAEAAVQQGKGALLQPVIDGVGKMVGGWVGEIFKPEVSSGSSE